MRRLTTFLGGVVAALCLLPHALRAQTLPELPRVQVDITMPAITRTVRVPATGLQAAIDSARPGDAIRVQNGTSVVGPIVLRRHAPGWVTITADSVPVAPGQRMTPTAAATLPTLLTDRYAQPALVSERGASGYRIIGLRVLFGPDTKVNYGMVWIGRGDETVADSQPSRIVLDRVYVTPGTEGETSRCVALNGSHLAVIDSWLADCHGKGLDTQAILGWSGAGPVLIANNHLEGAGQNIMFGGADPRVPGQSPSDITIIGNHLFKPLSWGGGTWTVKAAFELKHAQRVLFEGNVIENHWTDAQTGVAILYQAGSQDCTAPWSRVWDVTARGNVIRNSLSGITVLAKYNQRACDAAIAPSERIAFVGNWFQRLGIDPISGAGGGRLVQLFGGLTDATVANNTFAGSGVATTLMLDGTPPQTRLTLTGNAWPESQYGIFASGGKMGRVALDAFAPGAVWSDGAGADTTALAAMADKVTAGAPVVLPTPPIPVPPTPTPPVVAPAIETAPVGFALASGAGVRTQVRTERTVCREGGVVRGVITLASPSRYAVHLVRGGAWVTRPTTYTSRAAAIAACYAP